MLPVARLIGHKEWTARKSDPRHDMNWRRGRVAGFTPRGATERPPHRTNREDDDTMLIECDYKVENGKVTQHVFGIYSGGVLIGRAGAERTGFDQQVAAGATVMWVAPDTWDLMDRRGRMLVGEVVSPAQQAALDASAVAAARGGQSVNIAIDAETLTAAAPAIGEALAAANDRRARDGDPATGPVS